MAISRTGPMQLKEDQGSLITEIVDHPVVTPSPISNQQGRRARLRSLCLPIYLSYLQDQVHQKSNFRSLNLWTRVN